jgi:phenylpropionate dioxygenase-like ring-hydroxylating dioxygenase large terminal subunit
MSTGDGWRPVASVRSVPPAAVVAAQVDGRALVVWRPRSGPPVVMDARCPHQWSDLVVDGVVAGDELVCVTHCWRFTADGRASKLNLEGRRDDEGRTPISPTRERDGMIEARLDPSTTGRP